MKFLDKLFPGKSTTNTRASLYDEVDKLLERGTVTSISWVTSYDVDGKSRSARILLCVSNDNDSDAILESKALIKAALSGVVMGQEQLDDAFLSHQLGLD